MRCTKTPRRSHRHLFSFSPSHSPSFSRNPKPQLTPSPTVEPTHFSPRASPILPPSLIGILNLCIEPETNLPTRRRPRPHLSPSPDYNSCPHPFPTYSLQVLSVTMQKLSQMPTFNAKTRSLSLTHTRTRTHTHTHTHTRTRTRTHTHTHTHTA